MSSVKILERIMQESCGFLRVPRSCQDDLGKNARFLQDLARHFYLGIKADERVLDTDFKVKIIENAEQFNNSASDHFMLNEVLFLNRHSAHPLNFLHFQPFYC